MRYDSLGFFWQDQEISTRAERRIAVRQMPPIPDTGWKPPKEFPNLSTVSHFCIDTETYDPNLEEKGPGWARKDGHIVGVAIGVPDGGRWYFPIRHEVEPEDNLPPEAVFSWLAEALSNPKQAKVGANIIYDVGWLGSEGVRVRGPLIDVQYAEALLEESGLVSLEHLGNKYLKEGKESNLLYKWCCDYYGGTPSGKQRSNIYRAPPRLVGPYAEGDVDLPLRILPLQYKLLAEQNLIEVFDLECRLIPLLVEMRKRGVRVNVAKAEALASSILREEQEELAKLEAEAGSPVDIYSADSIARAFARQGRSFPLTATGRPSFQKGWLEKEPHTLAKSIVQTRRLNKLRTVFVENYVIEGSTSGRLHCQFHPLRSDGFGARSGRLSSSSPNLQNIPIRDEQLGKLIRSVFVPDEGHRAWRKFDYSQIEFRFLVHYAVGPRVDEVIEHYRRDPSTDYHEFTLDLVSPIAGWDVSTKELRKNRRRPIKNINFGLVYGMGTAKLTSDLELSRNDGFALFNHYHKALPFVEATMKATMEEANRTGTITTILGRRSRFDLWEPVEYGRGGEVALPYKLALERYGMYIRRAHTHKALNRKLQGSAADLMKLAMVLCWERGVFDYTGVPGLTVHDELDFSDPGGVDDAFEEVRHIMESCMCLRIPVRADMEVGPSWGEVG